MWKLIVRKRAHHTAIKVYLHYPCGLALPVALIDALGVPDRVHLFKSKVPGELWICPTIDEEGYKLSYRSITAPQIFEELQIDGTKACGDWFVEDDRVIVRFTDVEYE